MLQTLNLLGGGQISYDNTSSGLSATNVQGAIDELSDRINLKVTSINLIITNGTIDVNISNYIGSARVVGVVAYGDVSPWGYSVINGTPSAFTIRLMRQVAISDTQTVGFAVLYYNE